MQRGDMNQERERPKVAAEVRAWVIASIAIAVQFGGLVWWGATNSAKLEALQASVGELKAQIGAAYTDSEARRDLAPLRDQVRDHEERIRAIERARATR